MNDKVQDNLERLRALVAAYPDTNIYLDRFCVPEGKHEGCGTLFCVAGLMATNEHFQTYGYRLAKERPDSAHGQFFVYRNDQYIFEMSTNEDINVDVFGIDAYKRLFDQRGEGFYDGDLLGWEKIGDYDEMRVDRDDISDKDLALYRIDRQIKLHKYTAV